MLLRLKVKVCDVSVEITRIVEEKSPEPSSHHHQPTLPIYSLGYYLIRVNDNNNNDREKEEKYQAFEWENLLECH
ncbi:CLUMA_CG015665, isoform A [Clunio marinus]|uniref:CLUMA_CG015665, isoform A n=1 Tax=Clunio marinus TaxID=568069 RepID=A0A1J1IPQ5_9DIPT|nr:CLUMA_CG015665, isoform A [Clunio marinus]